MLKFDDSESEISHVSARSSEHDSARILKSPIKDNLYDIKMLNSRSVPETENIKPVSSTELPIEDYGLSLLSACLVSSSDLNMNSSTDLLLTLEYCDADDSKYLNNSDSGFGLLELEKKNAKWYLSRYRRQDESAFLKLLEKIGAGQRM